eukprot:g6125.t1
MLSALPLSRAKHLFAMLNGGLVAAGTLVFIMGLYVYTDPHLSEMHGEDDMAIVCVRVMALGGGLLALAALGCKVIVGQERSHVDAFCGAVCVLALLQVYYGGRLSTVFASADLDACAHSHSASGRTACDRFARSRAHVGAYVLWQQMWSEAMKPLPDTSAQSVLQQVQDAGKCCGFGDQKQCRSDRTPTQWLDGARAEPRQRCTKVPGAPTEYCYNIAQGGSYIAHCSIKNQWDFPYGAFDGCQERNQRSGRGCAAHFALYVNAAARRALQWCSLLLLLEAAAGAVALRLRAALVCAAQGGGNGGGSSSYQTVPGADGGGDGVASGQTLSI